jgi:hypothetical protein
METMTLKSWKEFFSDMEILRFRIWVMRLEKSGRGRGTLEKAGRAVSCRHSERHPASSICNDFIARQSVV